MLTTQHQLRCCAQATNGKWYSYDVTRTTAQQIGRAFGAGYGAAPGAALRLLR
jgi:hypothetical protein